MTTLEPIYRSLRSTDIFKQGDEYFYLSDDLSNPGLHDGKWLPVSHQIGLSVSRTDYDPELCRRPIKSYEDLV